MINSHVFIDVFRNHWKGFSKVKGAIKGIKQSRKPFCCNTCSSNEKLIYIAYYAISSVMCMYSNNV